MDRPPGSTAMIEEVLSNLHVLLAYMDCDFNILHVNEAYAQASHQRPEYFVGKNHFDLFPSAENEAIFRRVVETGQPAVISEKPFVHPQQRERGTTYWDWTLAPIRDDANRVEGVVLSLLDVSDRVAARERLEAAAEYARNLFEASPDLMAAINLEGRLVDVNSAAESLVGVSRQDSLGKAFIEFATDPERAQAGFQEVLKQGVVRDVPLDLRHRDGRHIPTLISASLLSDRKGEVTGVLVTARDISEQRKQQQERDRLYRELQNKVDELSRNAMLMAQAERIGRLGYWQVDLASGTASWSEQAFHGLGLEPDITPRRFEEFLSFVHEQDRSRVKQAQREVLAGQDFHDLEFRIRRVDGEERFVCAQGQFQRGTNGQPQSFVGVFQDITETKRLELMLRERFRVMADAINDVVWVGTPNYDQTLYVNPAYERIWGRKRVELYRHPEGWLQAVHPDDRAKVEAGAARHGGSEWQTEYRIVRPDHAVRIIHEHSYRLLDETARPSLIICIATDITQLKNTEQVLKKTVRQLAKANRELKQISYHDPLTGVANRRLLDKFIEQGWRHERRYCRTVALVMVDLDHFKAYNDFYGHPRGDDCLQRVAAALALHVHRPTDFVTRIGGEEFAVLLPDTTLPGAVKLAEEMRESVLHLGIEHPSSPSAAVMTISVGVAAVNACTDEFRALFSQADQALYTAKSRGRNRVEAFNGA